ncbi:MAG: hypothetical protein GXO08_05590 [Aquificae bacterium]|nr:hypothetical protein [Aquificota bacterium]
MQTVLSLLTVVLVSILLLLEVFPLLKPKKETLQTEPRAVYETPYTLSLEGDLGLVELLLKEGFRFTYSDGKVFLVLTDQTKVKRVLNLYGEYEKRRKLEKLASAAVLPLIEEDALRTSELLKEVRKELQTLKEVLKARKALPNLGVFEEFVLELQRETFTAYSAYWDKKREQILNGFKEFVPEPEVDYARLLEKARQYYGDTLKVKFFELYLKEKLLESRLEADYYKYKEYGG